MIELQEIVHRLRVGQSVKAIHRETGRHKTVIRTLRLLAQREGWLSTDRELPSEGELKRLYEEAREIVGAPHTPWMGTTSGCRGGWVRAIAS